MGYNHQTGFNKGGLCLQNSLSVFWFGFCLLLGLSVFWLVVMFGIGFVCQLGVMFGIGFMCFWVCKYVIMPFNSREGVSVGLFH